MAKQTVNACMFSGSASGGACSSPVSRRDSKPVTYSVRVSGRSAPVSVASAGETAHRDASHPVSLDVGVDGTMAEQHDELPARHVGREHRLQHGQRHARFMRETRHRSVAGVEVDDGAGLFGQRVVTPVVLPDGESILAIGLSTAERLDPRMFVGRHGLGRDLAADPVGLFGEDDAGAVPERRDRRGNSAKPTADDGDVRPAFLGRQPRREQQGARVLQERSTSVSRHGQRLTAEC
jgi:hypothetical protein